MYETEPETRELQSLIDASLGRSTAHLQSIITGERSLTAEQLGSVWWISSRLRDAQARTSRRCRRRRSNPGIGDSSALRGTHLDAARSA